MRGLNTEDSEWFIFNASLIASRDHGKAFSGLSRPLVYDVLFALDMKIRRKFDAFKALQTFIVQFPIIHIAQSVARNPTVLTVPTTWDRNDPAQRCGVQRAPAVHAIHMQQENRTSCYVKSMTSPLPKPLQRGSAFTSDFTSALIRFTRKPRFSSRARSSFCTMVRLEILNSVVQCVYPQSLYFPLF